MALEKGLEEGHQILPAGLIGGLTNFRALVTVHEFTSYLEE